MGIELSALRQASTDALIKASTRFNQDQRSAYERAIQRETEPNARWILEMILDNAINRGRKLITAEDLEILIESGQPYKLIDARVMSQYEKGHIRTAENIPHAQLRDALKDMDSDTIAVTYCNKGVTGNAAQNILMNHGFKEVYNLSGGHKQFSKTHKPS